MKGFVTESEAAKLTGIGVRTLIRYRDAGLVKPYLMFRRAVVYDLAQLIEDLVSNGLQGRVRAKALNAKQRIAKEVSGKEGQALV